MSTAFRAFLGNGLLRPFQRDKKQDFANAAGEALVRACVGQILGTQCSDDGGTILGELPWRPEFGSLLYRLKHRKGFVRDEMARVYVAQALQRWEPRISVSQAEILSFENLTLTIRIRYSFIDRNVASNQVALQDIEQTVSLPVAA